MSKGDDASRRSAISERMMEVIREREISQADLVRATGATSPTVSDWFNKGALPDPDKLASVCRFLRINGHWLLTGTGPKSAPGETATEADRAFAVGARAVIVELERMVAALKIEFSPARANPSLDEAALAAMRVIERTSEPPQRTRRRVP